MSTIPDSDQVARAFLDRVENIDISRAMLQKFPAHDEVAGRPGPLSKNCRIAMDTPQLQITFHGHAPLTHVSKMTEEKRRETYHAMNWQKQHQQAS